MSDCIFANEKCYLLASSMGAEGAAGNNEQISKDFELRICLLLWNVADTVG